MATQAFSALPDEPIGTRRESLWVPVTRELTERIVSGEYPSDTAIPTEAELGEELGVSRTVVRESVRLLVDKRLVRIERGRGTMVQPRERWRTFDPTVLAARLARGDRVVVMRELLQLRRAIEPELAGRVAEDPSDVAIARLGARVEALEAAKGDGVTYSYADQAFHSTLAELSGVSLAHEILELMSTPIAMARERWMALPDTLRTAHAHHLEIFGAIRDRDPERARRAMRAHMDWNEERIDQIA